MCLRCVQHLALVVTSLSAALQSVATSPGCSIKNGPCTYNVVLQTYSEVSTREALRQTERRLNDVQAHLIQMMSEMKDLGRQIEELQLSAMAKAIPAGLGPGPVLLDDAKSLPLQSLPQEQLKIVECGVNFTTNTDLETCHKMIPEYLNWYNAAKYCAALKAKLVSIETREEMQYIVSLIEADPVTKTKNFWTSGTDALHEGHWLWSGTHQRMTYTNWKPREPNGGLRENCLNLYPKHNYTWNDSDCNMRFFFICETIPLSVVT